MSHAAQLPVNRGFNSSLAMLSGAADHYTNERENFVDLWLDHAPAHGLNGTYSLFRYMEHALGAISSHDPAVPLFLYMAFQDVHSPTQSPERFFDLYNASIYAPRHKGLGQISAVDEAIGNLTAALRAKGMWERTLFIFSSDNGGPADHEPNFPLRGAKGSDFEGGTRTVAFASGGLLPHDRRGTSVDGLIHVCDWYATFAHLAGINDVTDHTAAAAGLPPVDALNVWPLIANDGKSPRVEVPLSGGPKASGSGLIVDCSRAGDVCPGSKGRWKLVRGKQGNAFYPGPTTPNGTDAGDGINCSQVVGGCLFSLDDDPYACPRTHHSARALPAHRTRCRPITRTVPATQHCQCHCRHHRCLHQLSRVAAPSHTVPCRAGTSTTTWRRKSRRCSPTCCAGRLPWTPPTTNRPARMAPTPPPSRPPSTTTVASGGRGRTTRRLRAWMLSTRGMWNSVATACNMQRGRCT